MADKNFSEFSNQTSPVIGDFVVGYRGSTEQRYTLEVISGLIAAGPLTTAGDLWGYSSQNIRIPAGSDGQVLIVDSTEAAGLKWDDAGAGTLASVTNVGDGSGVISGTIGNAVKVKSIALAGGLFFPDGMGTPGDTITISGLAAHAIGPADNVGNGTGILQTPNTTVTTGNIIYGEDEGNWYAGTQLTLIADGTSGRAQHYYPSNGKIKMVRNSPGGTYHAGFASEFVKVDVDTSSLNFMSLSGAGTIALRGLGAYGGEVGNVIVISGSGAGNWQNNGSNLYYNEGNVGIGTDDPQETLHITGGQIISGDNGVYRLRLQSDGSVSNYISFTHPLGLSYIGADVNAHSGFYMLADNDLPLYLGHVTDQAMRIDYKSALGESNVVIGDALARPGSGSELLTLRRTGGMGGQDGPVLILENTNSLSGDQIVRFKQDGGMHGGSWAIGQSTASAVAGGADWNSFRLAYSGGADVRATLGVGDKLIIDTSGRLTADSVEIGSVSSASSIFNAPVGIGLTPSPGMLEVSGDGKDGLVVYSNSNASNFNAVFDDTEDAGADNTTADSPGQFWFLYDASGLDAVAKYYRYKMGSSDFLEEQSGIYQLNPPGATNVKGDIWLGTVGAGQHTFTTLSHTGIRAQSAHPFRIAAEKGMVPSGDGVVSLGSSDHSWATGLFTNVGIGDNDPRTLSTYPFMLTDTAGTQTLANFSGNNSNYAAVRAEGATGSHSLPSRVSLAAGYDAGLPAGHENQGGGLLANSQITFHVGSTLIAHMTGRAGYGCLIVGNDYHSNTQKGNYAETHEPSVLVFGHSDDNSAKLELVNTGSIARNNQLGFVHGSNTESDTKSRWTLVQDITGDGDQDNSDFVIAYKEGDGETDLSTDTVVTLSNSKHMLPGNSGVQNLGSVELPYGKVFSDSLAVGVHPTSFVPSANQLHVAGTQVLSGDTTVKLSLTSTGAGTSASQYISWDHPSGISYLGTVCSSIPNNDSDVPTNYMGILANDNLPLFLGHVGFRPIRIDYDATSDKGNVVIGDDSVTAPVSGGRSVLTVRNSGLRGAPLLSLESTAPSPVAARPSILYKTVGFGRGDGGPGNYSWLGGAYNNDLSYRLSFTGRSAEAQGGTGDMLIVHSPSGVDGDAHKPGSAGAITPGQSGTQNLGLPDLSWQTGYLEHLEATSGMSLGTGVGSTNIIDNAPDFLVSGGNVMVGTGAPGAYKVHIKGATHVEGAFSASSKSFLIDHPLNPGKVLHYGSLEGPEYGAYVRGKLENNNVISLPDYWTALVDADTITAQLTPYGSSQSLYVQSISNNQIVVGSDQAEVYCHYFVQAARKDIGPLVVERTKE